MPTNNKFLQILRNFDSTSREQAAGKLGTVAQGNLYHAGTPVVAFYTAKTRSFANRSAAKTYGTDATRTYKALLGIMGAQQGDIEIFDIETSVEAILGGASQITTSANSVFPSKTWDFTSLGGVQVVIEQMDEVLTTEIGNLKTRITNITGQSGSTYQATQGNAYTGQSGSLQDAIDDLDAALAGLASTVSGNKVDNQDGSIIVDPTGTDDQNNPVTYVSVNLDANDHVLALDPTDGLYTNILIKKVVRTGEGSGDQSAAGTNEVIDTLGTNVKEAYRLYGTDNTQLGQQINIYKDSSLKEVYLGASTDTINATTGVITKNTVTDPQSMNFAYQLADGTYELVKIDVSKFLTESEFSDGLDVNAGVVSVKKDTTSGKVRIADTPSGVTPGSAQDTGLADVLTVGSGGVKIDNIQAAIDYAVVNGGSSIIASTMTATSDGNLTVASTAETAQHVYIRQATDASGAKTYEFLETDIASEDALDAEVLRAGTAEAAIDTAVGLTKAANGETRTYTSQVTLGTGETAPTTVAGDINLLDAHVEALSDSLEGLDGEALASTAPTAVAYSGTNNDEFQVLTRVNQVDGEVQTVDNTAGSDGSKSVTLKKVAATGAAADVAYTNTTSGLSATTVQAAIDELKSDTLAATTEVVGEAQAPDPTANPAVPAGNGVYVTESTDATDSHTVYTVAIDVFDCGTY